MLPNHNSQNFNRITGPKYHADRLIVKMRQTPTMLGMTVTAASSFVEHSPGLSLIDRMEKAGLILKVTSMDSAVTAVRRGAALRMSTAYSRYSAGERDLNAGAGISMIQTTEARDADTLQMAFASDPNVEYVSRVPIRFLLAKKKVKSRKRKKATKSTMKKARRSTKKKVGIAAFPPSPLIMWNLQRINWSQARSAGLNDASSVKVAVLDTGIDLGHPDLDPNTINYVYDFGTSETSASDQDIMGHGTHVTGTIAALINNSVGIHGVCNCQIAAYKIFEDAVTDLGLTIKGFGSIAGSLIQKCTWLPLCDVLTTKSESSI